MIQTVLGKVASKEIGYILAHEHLVMDLSHIRQEEDSILGDVHVMTQEVLSAKTLGLSAVVDVSNTGMGQDINRLVKISEATGIHVVASTGFYQDCYYMDEVRRSTVDELAAKFIHQLCSGIDGTSHKAGVIAEIGSSHQTMTDDEKKVFRAAAKAAKKTGAAIFTHCELGTMALEQVALLLGEGVGKHKMLIGHMDLVDDVEYLKHVLCQGVSIAFDTIGKIGYVTDERRLEKLAELLEAGYEDQVVLSLDITRQSYLRSNGGHGYDHMFTTFIPKMKEQGINNTLIKKLLSHNALRLLERPE